MDQSEATTRLLDVAEELFYERGIHAVGMAEIRDRSGVSLKRLYQCFPAKEDLVVGYLRRRDERWRAELAHYVEAHSDGGESALLAVFDWLHQWFAEPGFRGCAFINCFGEFGKQHPAIADAVRDHKAAVRRYLAELAGADRAGLVDQLLALIDGATAAAAIGGGSTQPARASRAAARTLLAAV